MIQQSLVLMKPDSVQRGIVGEILHRFERAGLKIVASKMLIVDKELTKKHYAKDSAWHKKVGEVNIKDCENFGIDINEMFGTTDAIEIGKIVNEWLFDIFSGGPVMAFVIEGVNAVDKIRSLVGPTYPSLASPGTIRGDFGIDSPFSALKRKRAVFNLLHASGTVEEAKHEIDLWFDKKEIVSYDRPDHSVYSY